jgi:hypothetical protein
MRGGQPLAVESPLHVRIGDDYGVDLARFRQLPQFLEP